LPSRNSGVVLARSITPKVPGANALMVKGSAVDVPPPGSPFSTVILAIAAAARSEGGMVARNNLLLSTCVERAAPLKRRVLDAMKPVPLTSSARPGHPAGASLSTNVAIVGCGFVTRGAIVKFTACEVPPPGEAFTTCTGTVAALARSAAVSAI
jgi:hypothetical protein